MTSSLPHLLPVLLGRDVTAEVARVVHGLQLAEDVYIWRAVHLDRLDGWPEGPAESGCSVNFLIGLAAE